MNWKDAKQVASALDANVEDEVDLRDVLNDLNASFPKFEWGSPGRSGEEDLERYFSVVVEKVK